MNRITIEAAVHPKVAVAVHRDELGWILLVNPELTTRRRRIAVREAHQYIDGLLSGWSYVPPVGGCDVLIEDSFLSVVEPTSGSRRHPRDYVQGAGAFAVGVLAPLSALAPVVHHFTVMVAPAVGA